VDVVRNAELSGLSGASAVQGGGSLSPVARDVCAFASIVAGREVTEGRGGVWPKLFYCE
jgi:hypothetical protein